MTASDYMQLIKDTLQRFRELHARREEIDVELGKLRQFMTATVNMVPDSERVRMRREVEETVEKATASTASLADSIRKVFTDNPNYMYTVAGMREGLIDAGFDFSSYRSNPLSSISTTMRRMADTGELESKEDEQGITIFILRKPKKLADEMSDLRRKIGPWGRGGLREALERTKQSEKPWIHVKDAPAGKKK